MTECLVDQAKAVDAEGEDRNAFAAAPGTRDRLRDQLSEQRPVSQAGQGIMQHRQPLDAVELDHVRGRACQVAEDPQVTLTPVTRACVDGAERAQHVAVAHPQRHPRVGDHAKVADSQVVGHQRVRPSVVDHQRLAAVDDVLTEGM